MTISVTKPCALTQAIGGMVWADLKRQQMQVLQQGQGWEVRLRAKNLWPLERVRGEPDSVHVAYLQGDPAHCQPPSALLQDSILLE